MKKSLALVLALVMVLSSFSFVSAAPDFADVKGTIYEDAVGRLELLNVLKGYPDGSFQPNGLITRAEFAAVAVRVRGLESVAVASKGLPSGFSDVPAGHWAAGYIGVAGSTGIVNGIGGGLFAPNAHVKYEEAVTMLVRALGYEVSAQAKGGYPFGYLIVAQEIGLLDGVNGTMGVPAVRGLVALLTDNSLEIPMMIQVGFGADTKWVVSGSKEHDGDEVYLLDFMGFKAYEGVVKRIDVSKSQVEIDGKDSDMDGWYNAPAGFDYFTTHMANIKVWLDGDDIAVYTLKDKVYFDAFEVDGDEIDLVTADLSFDLGKAAPADDEVLADAEFAKIVVNKDGKVDYIGVFELDGFILVDKVDDEIIIDLNDDELDVEDFAIVKGGKSVDVSDLAKGDLIFFVDEDILGGEFEGLAIVLNNSKTGKIDRVYTDSFRFGGKNYTFDATYAMYLDGTDLDGLTMDIIEGMFDEESEVEIFFNFNGDIALVVGKTGNVTTSSFYAVVTEKTQDWIARSGKMWSLDVLTEKGEEVAYDLKDTDINATVAADEFFKGTWDATTIKAGVLVKITVDEDGEVTNVEKLTTHAVAEAFDIEDSYAKVGAVSYRLQASTVVFYDYNSDGAPEEVIAFGDVDDEFYEIEIADIFHADGRVKVILAKATDADTDKTEVTGLVTNVRHLRDGYVEFTMEVAGAEKVYTTEDKVAFGTSATGEEIDMLIALNETIAKVMVGDVTGKLVKFGTTPAYAELVAPKTGTFTVVSRSTVDKTILVYEQGVGNFTIELLSNTVIYDKELDIINLRDLAANDGMFIYMDGSSNRFVKYIILKVIK
jgi:hypothetical protein